MIDKVRQLCPNRICPGRYYADASLFITIVSVLHTLEIHAPKDDNGQPIRAEPQTSSGLITSVARTPEWLIIDVQSVGTSITVVVQ